MQIFLQLIAVESTVMQNMNDYACQAVYRSITAPTAGKHPESLCGTRDYQSTAFLHEALIDLQSCVQGKNSLLLARYNINCLLYPVDCLFLMGSLCVIIPKQQARRQQGAN